MSILLAFCLVAAQDFRAQEGLVNDFAKVLDGDSRAKVYSACEGLRTDHKFVLVVVTVPSLQGMSVEDYTVRLANKWGVGQKGSNNGVVFLIAPNERKLRIENGYGTETTLTDIETKRIIESVIIPRMKEKNTAQAIVDGTAALVGRLGGTTTGPPPSPPEDSMSPAMILGIFAAVILGILLLVIILNVTSGGGGGGILGAISSGFSSSSGSSSSSSSSSSGSSGSDGGSFGGGGASGSW